MFRGEIADPEIWEDCRGDYWAPWIRLFIPLVQNRHGFFQHFPYAGAYMDQPATTMQILDAIRAQFCEYLKEANKVAH